MCIFGTHVIWISNMRKLANQIRNAVFYFFHKIIENNLIKK